MTISKWKIEEYSSKIVAFCCERSAYQAVDKAGQMRLNYPSNIRIVPVPCSGRVSEANILQALEKGADGVVVLGCPEGSCHHISGSSRAKKRVESVSMLLKEIGLGSGRVQMVYLAPNMTTEFVRIANDMLDKIRTLGPIGTKKTN